MTHLTLSLPVGRLGADMVRCVSGGATSEPPSTGSCSPGADVTDERSSATGGSDPPASVIGDRCSSARVELSPHVERDSSGDVAESAPVTMVTRVTSEPPEDWPLLSITVMSRRYIELKCHRRVIGRT